LLITVNCTKRHHFKKEDYIFSGRGCRLQPEWGMHAPQPIHCGLGHFLHPILGPPTRKKTGKLSLFWPLSAGWMFTV